MVFDALLCGLGALCCFSGITYMKRSRNVVHPDRASVFTKMSPYEQQVYSAHCTTYSR